MMRCPVCVGSGEVVHVYDETLAYGTLVTGIPNFQPKLEPCPFCDGSGQIPDIPPERKNNRMKPRPEPTCRHRFVLGDSRTGSEAVGKCKLCGIQKAFANNYGLALPKGRNMAQNIHTAMVREGRALHGSTGMEGLDLAQPSLLKGE